MLHPFISSPYASGHLTPVLALSASVHAALIFAAVTSTGAVRRTHAPAMVTEVVRFADLSVRRMPSRAPRSERRSARARPVTGEEAFRLPEVPGSFDLILPDAPVLPDYQPDLSAMDFGWRTGIADDVLHLGLNAGRSGAASGASYGAFDEASVESRAMPVPENRSPRYPSRMAGRGIETRFNVIFVVDTTGAVVQESVEWPLTVQPEFTSAVADVLSNWRFVPAQIGGRRVRQRVLQPFHFRLDAR